MSRRSHAVGRAGAARIRSALRAIRAALLALLALALPAPGLAAPGVSDIAPDAPDAGPAGAPAAAPEAFFDRAAGLMSEGEHDRAASLFVELAEAHPDHPLAAEALFSAARLYEERLAQPGRALSLYRILAVLYTNRIIPTAEQAPRLRWIQFHWAGMDHTLDAPILKKPGVMASTLSVAAASQMGEYVLEMLLSLGHRLPKILAYQKRAEWPRDRWERFLPAELRGNTVGIVGYGRIGRQSLACCSHLAHPCWRPKKT